MYNTYQTFVIFLLWDYRAKRFKNKTEPLL